MLRNTLAILVLLGLAYLTMGRPSTAVEGKRLSPAEASAYAQRVAALARPLGDDYNPQWTATLAQRLIALLPDYSGVGAIEEAIARLAACEVEEIERVSSSRRVAASRDTVYFVDQGRSVVKVFPLGHGGGNFLATLSASQLFCELKLEKSKHPHLLGVGLCQVGSQTYGLVHMSLVQGTVLTELVKQPEIAAHAAYRLGEALAELHGRGTPSWTSIPRDELDELVLKRKWLPEQAQELVEDAVAAVAGLSVRASYLHGDATLKNVLYQPQSDALGFVDLCDAHHSVDAIGRPTGVAARDFTQMEQALLSLDPELDPLALAEAFREGYGQETNPLVYHFYRLKRCADRIRDYQIREKRWKSEDERLFLTYRYEAALDYLQACLAERPGVQDLADLSQSRASL